MTVVLDDRRGRWGAVELARLRGLSWISIFAGIFVAYAVFPVLLGVTGGVLNAINLDVDLSRTNWREVGVAAGIVAALLLLSAWTLGAYVAGRMAQRSGTIHGVVLFVGGLLVLFVAAWLADLPEGGSDLALRLRDFGVPASLDQWRQVASVAGIIALTAMLAGSLLGGALAQRFQSKVTRQAVDQVNDRMNDEGEAEAVGRPREAGASQPWETIEVPKGSSWPVAPSPSSGTARRSTCSFPTPSPGSRPS